MSKNYGFTECDEMDPSQWYYSSIHNSYKHIYTGKQLTKDSWHLWFGNISKRKEDCYHEWKKIVLSRDIVYDCLKCGVKKEDYEKQRLSEK